MSREETAKAIQTINNIIEIFKNEITREDAESITACLNEKLIDEMDFLYTKAWKSLPISAPRLFLSMKQTAIKKYKESGQEAHSINDVTFTFSFATAKKGQGEFDLYTNKSSFYKDIRALISHGFIDLVSSGFCTNTKNVYKLSDRWKTWNENSPSYEDLEPVSDYYVYVLELEDGCFYVGITTNLEACINAHMSGNGSEWTKLHPPIRLKESKKYTCGAREILQLEADYTEGYANLYGPDKVHGAGRVYKHGADYLTFFAPLPKIFPIRRYNNNA